ncbi:uncharacterized protein V6R79_017181 [Siganus canaliculatus]
MAERQFTDSAKPGDLIEVFRAAYRHWAIYIGDYEVVHLVTPNDDVGSFSSVVMAIDSNRAVVKRQKIWEVTDGDRFKINNLLDHKYQPRERHVIVREAISRVGEELPYSITSQNCEHFVTMLRYGKAESRQVQDAVVIGGTVLAGIGILAAGIALFSAFSGNDEKQEEETQQRQRRQSRQSKQRHQHWRHQY